MGSSTIAVRTPATSYIDEYDAIAGAVGLYDKGVRTGKSSVMKPAFHENSSFFGFYRGNLLAGSTQILFDWVDNNGPVPDMRLRIVRIDIYETIAVASVELENVTGKLAGESGARLSDSLQLIKINGEWKISQKSFHWHGIGH